MIEICMVCDDPYDERDGDIIAEFRVWAEAIEYCDWYRKAHAKVMEQDDWGICAYNTRTGASY